MRGEVRSGLDKASLLPIGGGYLEATAGVRSTAGVFGRIEAGLRPAQSLTVFGYGQVASGLPGLQAFGPVWEAGVGLRVGW
ncbi:MAG: hypothetical protein WAZ94_15330 [Phycisphaerales bacterium]|nr:hypothetical protein [Chloroflexota bacterium]